jgi:hypothetical protein
MAGWLRNTSAGQYDKNRGGEQADVVELVPGESAGESGRMVHSEGRKAAVVVNRGADLNSFFGLYIEIKHRK